jgi:hypothetical protein
MARATAPKKGPVAAKVSAPPAKATRAGFSFEMEKGGDDKDAEFKRAG